MEITHVLANKQIILDALENNSPQLGASLVLRHLTEDAPKINLEELTLRHNAMAAFRILGLDESQREAFVRGYLTLGKQLREYK